MKIGIFGINTGACAEPQTAAKVAVAAEQIGVESLWTAEHVVLPDPREAPSPADPETPFLHPSTLLAYIANVTDEIKLGTGITLIAQRNPVVLAKEMGSLDVISSGRLLLGIGAGYLHQEFSALGVDFSSRGAKTDESIEIIRTLWNNANPEYQGKFIQFKNIQAQPRPIQAGGPPIIIGGTSPAALRRTVTHGNGWYGFALDVETTKSVLENLEIAKSRYERDPNLGPLSISITPPSRPSKTMMEDYAAIGVDRYIPILASSDEATSLTYLDNLNSELF
ncbi:MAG: LLM class F420-dependent oxidoreductase [Candidatus Azotimanducaceae bacterium]